MSPAGFHGAGVLRAHGRGRDLGRSFFEGWYVKLVSEDRSTRLAWDVTVDAKADVEVEIQQSLSDKEPRTVRVTLGPDSRIIPAQTTPGSEDFTVVSAGSFSLPRAGSWRLWVEAVEAPPAPGDVGHDLGYQDLAKEPPVGGDAMHAISCG